MSVHKTYLEVIQIIPIFTKAPTTRDPVHSLFDRTWELIWKYACWSLFHEAISRAVDLTMSRGKTCGNLEEIESRQDYEP